MPKVGDTIKCADKDDCIKTMNELAKEGIETDFLYDRGGRKRTMAGGDKN